MTPSASASDSILVSIILVTLAAGLPVVLLLLIRFLWDRNLNLGRSKDLDKLIWQLHRIASAMEHQMHLSFPPVQPGTEEARDVAFLNQIAVEPRTAKQVDSTEVLTASPASEPAPIPATKGQASAPIEKTSAQITPLPETLSGTPKRGGVNSMFGL